MSVALSSLKLIWTEQDLAEWYEKYPFDPFLKLEVKSKCMREIEETARFNAIIIRFVVRFPMGLMGLVGVSLWKGETELTQEISLYDAVYDVKLPPTCLKKGERVLVRARNRDEKCDHLVGVRVDVMKKEGKR